MQIFYYIMYDIFFVKYNIFILPLKISNENNNTKLFHIFSYYFVNVFICFYYDIKAINFNVASVKKVWRNLVDISYIAFILL